MKKFLLTTLIIIGVAGFFWAPKGWTAINTWRGDSKIAKFNAGCDTLILGIQQYREFVGTYPTGNNATITKALLGQTGDKKVLILAVRRSEINDKGEITDPWGTPLQFYFSQNEVLIRSAGPNRAWQDDAVASDDLYRCAGKEK